MGSRSTEFSSSSRGNSTDGEESSRTSSSTIRGLSRLSKSSKVRNIQERYLPPENLLEIKVTNPKTYVTGKEKFTDYEIIIRVRFFFFITGSDVLLYY
jgi:pantothenate kinase